MNCKGINSSKNYDTIYKTNGRNGKLLSSGRQEGFQYYKQHGAKK